ncbi:MAG TPA: hypothetical protein EYN85_09940 [Candidatus Lambdaproteobacteria bacterium]|nr:hypothetical protein [Candidatus Lambdaproteobacteria bacterium]
MTYGGSCSSSTTAATSGNNTIDLSTLSDGTYDNCTITVTDSAGNAGNTITLTAFTIDTVAPTVTSIFPSDGATQIGTYSIGTGLIYIIFSEVMDPSSITVNNSNTACSGTIQVSADSFSTCLKMAQHAPHSPSFSINKTFYFPTSSNLDYSTTYKIRVTSNVADLVGNKLATQYTSSSGFTTDTQ